MIVFRILKFFGKVILYFLVSSIAIVVVYKFVPPPITPIMIIRQFEGWFEGKNIGIRKEWVPYEKISKNVFRAVVSAEDAKFMFHKGFDWEAIKAARRYNELRKGQKLRGASTISMQTAKNAFLWHGRNYVRKALEAYFTVLIEYIWGKKRIIEVYVNIIEFGEGIYGVQAAAEVFFHKNASELTQRESALLAAVLPNPRRWSPIAPTPYIEKRVAFIQGRMNSVVIPK
ncbi:monofunctional biosynthetic peptidoglycan transglycosylase [Bacteroidetes/Chlorobi group bacterium MS-B_bin-24]|jgi:monofunctional biosynthetic peptidoglycan transglycosylase|nr:MAG: monofunctional biosynthetic peptidoglycan transglycosylase [Bacteroidetes/Chlorobi group bacterium MS-B_bin-24]